MPKIKKYPIKLYKSEYYAYAGAKHRCTVESNRAYKYYGARGIKFQFKSFESFMDHLGPKLDPSLTLDRINNEDHYRKGNVRWATWAQQGINKRRVKAKIKISLDDENEDLIGDNEILQEFSRLSNYRSKKLSSFSYFLLPPRNT